jgi:PiT family inorganic phosphate transporter
MSSLTKILLTWLVCPILSAVIAIILYKLTTTIINSSHIHMFKLDRMTRWSLLLAGIFGSYALGANNIANVMGVFIPVSPFQPVSILGLEFNPTQQLFLIGGIAIAVGVFTYSKRVMDTVGQGIVELTPVAASVIVWSHTLVLFLFSSQKLESFLHGMNLPAIPLVPVSSSQAVIGAVMGIGILKRGILGVRWKMIGGIASGWITTPVIACFISFISLFFLQNVFQQQVYQPVHYTLSQQAINATRTTPAILNDLQNMCGREFTTAADFKEALQIVLPNLSNRELQCILQKSHTSTPAKD